MRGAQIRVELIPFASGDALHMADHLQRLCHARVRTHTSSKIDLSSVASIVIGSKSTITIDPPFLIPDALSVVEQAKSLNSNPVVAAFVTHHHPDHCFGTDLILEAFPKAKFYAAPYVRAGIDREFRGNVVHGTKVFGPENVPVSSPSLSCMTIAFSFWKAMSRARYACSGLCREAV
jgi:glyoxylase-like metal-dependent hydrolase (beta-lactamase superfamily II)